MNGYQSGLGSFCTFANGIKQASQGFENKNICQAAMGPDFEYKSDLIARRSENRQTEKDMNEAREMRETIEKMLLQWQSKPGA